MLQNRQALRNEDIVPSQPLTLTRPKSNKILTIYPFIQLRTGRGSLPDPATRWQTTAR